MNLLVHDEAMMTFSHPTFIEYFAALHLITLPRKEQLFQIQNPLIDKRFRVGVLEFYFGLLGDYYVHNITALSIPLKQFSAANTVLVNRWEHVCPPGHYTAYSGWSLAVHQEIGWKGKIYRDLLRSAEIGIDTGACVSLTSTSITSNSLHYILTHTRKHKLSIINYSPFLRTVVLEDMNHPLTISHLGLLDLLECLHTKYWSKCTHYYKDVSGLVPALTYYHFKLNYNSLQQLGNVIVHFDSIRSVGLTITDSQLKEWSSNYDVIITNFLVKFPARLNINLSLTLEIRGCYELWIHVQSQLRALSKYTFILINITAGM